MSSEIPGLIGVFSIEKCVQKVLMEWHTSDANSVDPDQTATLRRQTVKTLIRLLLEEQSDQGQHSLPWPVFLKT